MAIVSDDLPTSQAPTAWACATVIGALVLLAGCATPPAPTAPAPVVDAVVPSAAPVTTRGEFTLAADKLDVWNAVGQIVVRTDGARYEGRAQMLDLYSVRYRGESFLLLTRALPLSEAIRDTTTLVTAATASGKPIDTPAATDLLALLQRELPAEITRVRATQAAEEQAAAARAKGSKARKRRR